MRRNCPWCNAEGMQPYRNSEKMRRRRIAQAGHVVLVVGAVALLVTGRYFEAGLVAFGGFALMYAMMCSPFFNDFRVCAACGRIEAVTKNISAEELDAAS